MRPRFGRRELIAVASIGATALALGASFGPIVRAQVNRGAARRHLEVRVGSIRPGWFAARLLDVDVRPAGVSSFGAHIAEIRVGLSILLRPSELDVRGADLNLVGSVEGLRSDWQTWRGQDHERPVGAGPPLAVRVTRSAVHWTSPESGRADLHGLELEQDVRGSSLRIADGELRSGGASVEFAKASAELSPERQLLKAHVDVLTLGWAVSSRPASPDPEPAGVSAPAPPPAVVARTTRAHRGRGPTVAPGSSSTPLVALPNLQAARTAAAALALLLSDRIRSGADIGVTQLTWKMTQDQGHTALTFGPGPLSFSRTGSQLELLYTTNAQGTGTPLGLRVGLPTDGGDVVTTIEGGPVSLALLGVQEGAFGLMDVAAATVDGKARVVLAGDGAVLTFDTDARARGLSLNHPKLASQAVRGIDLGFRARGALTADGDLRLDDFAAALGAFHLSGSGTLEQRPDHAAGSLRFDVSSTACQSLLDSMPSGLLPALQGTRIAGVFGARGRFAFDTRDLDDLELNYDIQDKCRLTQVPASLDHDHFTRSFSHRIYLPDGTTTDEITGPGTPDWSSLEDISPYMQTAVLTTEDGAFPKHHGYNHAAIRQSIIANLKARSFVRGASTITMQLAKNLFLSRDKTLSRKLEEVIFTDYLEQSFSKDELMELYLNVIEFGPAVYGIAEAAEYYFGRAPAELDLAECLFLASLLPAPLRYSAMREADQPPDGWMRTIHNLMEVERKRGLITDAELAEGEGEPVVFWHGGPHPSPRAAAHTRVTAGAGDGDIPDPFETTVPDAP